MTSVKKKININRITMKVLIVIFSFVALAWGQSTIVSPCMRHGTAADLPINTYLVGCAGPSCSIPQLTTAEFQLVLRSPRQIRSMTTRAYVFLFGITIGSGVPYNLGPEAVTCNFFTNTYCPLQKDEVVTYNLRMEIEPFMAAGTQATVEFVITDDADDSVVTCLRIPIIITNPLSKTLAANTTVTV